MDFYIPPVQYIYIYIFFYQNMKFVAELCVRVYNLFLETISYRNSIFGVLKR
jgi:hypothetical protein